MTGEPDGRGGIHILAQLTAAAGVDSDELTTAVDTELRSRLAHYKVPRRYHIIKEDGAD